MPATHYLSAVAARRSFYQISSQSPPIDFNAIKNIVEEAVKYTPSPYNSQTGRAVLVSGEAHKATWSLIKTHILEWLPKGDAAAAKTHSDRIDGFAAGYGTVLFFEDQDVIADLNSKAPQ